MFECFDKLKDKYASTASHNRMDQNNVFKKNFDENMNIKSNCIQLNGDGIEPESQTKDDNFLKINSSTSKQDLEKQYKSNNNHKKYNTESNNNKSLQMSQMTNQLTKEIKRILEIHYNLLFAISNYTKKTFKEGINHMQDSVLIGYNNKAYEELIFLIETKVDFKKICNIICLINFTNHGFQSEHHQEIIFKVIESYPIKCVYTLLKMDSFGFFTRKDDVFKFAITDFDKNNILSKFTQLYVYLFIYFINQCLNRQFIYI